MAGTVYLPTPAQYVLVREWNDLSDDEREKIDQCLLVAELSTDTIHPEEKARTIAEIALRVTWYETEDDVHVLSPDDISAIVEHTFPEIQVEGSTYDAIAELDA